MARLLSIDEARASVLETVVPLDGERVAVQDALRRVLAEDVAAANDVPPFDNSAMDGFALTAGPPNRTLRIVGESRAGAPATAAPSDDEAIRVSTGAVVPDGTEAVVPVEQTSADGDGTITIDAEVRPAQHIRRAGEDMKRGERVLRSGTVLGPAELGVAVVAGRAHLDVGRRPRVALLITGDELRDPGEPLGPGEIHESNGITLGALVAQAGGDVVHKGRVGDSREATEQAIATALQEADVLILSGGVSVGPHDHVKPALEANGVEERFWRVALRPGKPTWFGRNEDTLVFGLPGNPVSAMVTFLLFVRPALQRLQGGDATTRRIRATLTEPVPRIPNRDEAVRVKLDNGTATPTGPQGSHQLTSMLAADGLAIVTAGDGTADEGTKVDVELI
ncbi:MAG TPA: gephyrin-like molybdotransferase Glp [Solirubrobacteraceae bacterium]|nr:gephyrin-like molybdotransferase Glp [Solirubrobacteraceae bacterium]